MDTILRWTGQNAQWTFPLFALLLVAVLLALYIRLAVITRTMLAALVQEVGALAARCDTIEHEQDVQASNIAQETSRAGGAAARLDLKLELLADFLYVRFKSDPRGVSLERHDGKALTRRALPPGNTTRDGR